MNLQAIDLNLLVVFEALMEERSVTRAAHRVGLSQPALSNALARLRRTFDDPLLRRTPEGMVPTPLAESLIAPVRAALAGLRSALEETPAFDPAHSERTFHLLANDYVESLLLAPLLARLGSEAPRIGLRLARPRSLFDAPPATALADAFDLALGFFPDSLSLDPSLRSQVLWEDRHVCIARNGHPQIRRRLSLEQYAAARHVAVFYKAQGPGLIDTLLAQQNLARRQAIFVPHFSSVPPIVAASDLIATVPERLARLYKHLRLQVLASPLPIPPFRLRMLWHGRREADRALAYLRALISEVAAAA